MTVKVNISDGAAFTINENGFSEVKTVDVTGLAGNESDMLFRASQTAGVPRYGDAHPAAEGVTVVSVDGRVEGAGHVRMAVTYRRPAEDQTVGAESGSGLLELNSNTATETTIEDVNGERMTVSWTGFFGDVSGTNPGLPPLITKTQIATARVQKPRLTAQIIRTESVFPGAKARAYTGKVNSQPWSGDPPFTWLCVGIPARERDNGTDYEVRYVFNYNPETWLFTARLTDGGVVPSTAELGNGVKQFNVYEAIDFNNLGVFVG